MTSKRTYEDGCATAHALDLIGERWALLVVRELILGPKRFTDLRAGLPAISPNVLTQRLLELERAGIVQRRKLPPPAAAWVYELSEWGLELERVIMALGRWAVRSPTLMQGYPLSVDALILSFRTMFSSDAADGFGATLEIRIGEDRFRAVVADGEMELTRNTARNPGAIIEADVNTLAAVVYGGRKFAEAVRSGDLRVEGNKAIAKQFLTLFPMTGAA
ncbi:MAG: transcriptional regulator [Acidobacteria bacterium]|nr:transcriptional regulator [Acidobacteriota bacterium]